MNSTYWLVNKNETAIFMSPKASASWLTDHNEWLELAISGVTGWLETQCQRKFVERVQIYTFISDGEDTVTLPQYPVNTITSWKDADGVEVFSDLSKLLLDSERGIIHLTTTLSGMAKYIVTYTAGYSSIPDDLKYACMYLIARLHTQRYGKIWATTQRSTTEGTITFDVKTLPVEITSVIEKYRRKP